MSSGMTTAVSSMYLADATGGTARTAPVAPMKLSPETVAGSAASAGTELGSTTRPSVTFGAPSGTPPVAGNSSAVTVVCGATGTVVADAIYDSASTPVRFWFGPLSASRAVVAGDSLLYATNSIQTSVTSP